MALTRGLFFCPFHKQIAPRQFSAQFYSLANNKKKNVCLKLHEYMNAIGVVSGNVINI